MDFLDFFNAETRRKKATRRHVGTEGTERKKRHAKALGKKRSRREETRRRKGAKSAKEAPKLKIGKEADFQQVTDTLSYVSRITAFAIFSRTSSLIISVGVL